MSVVKLYKFLLGYELALLIVIISQYFLIYVLQKEASGYFIKFKAELSVLKSGVYGRCIEFFGGDAVVQCQSGLGSYLNYLGYGVSDTIACSFYGFIDPVCVERNSRPISFGNCYIHSF